MPLNKGNLQWCKSDQEVGDTRCLHSVQCLSSSSEFKGDFSYYYASNSNKS